MDQQTPDNHKQPYRRHSSNWIVGAILILGGIFILLQNLNNFHLYNWWALFILIPAAGSFERAWSYYQSSGGRLTARARSAFVGGLILSLIAATFLFGLKWSILGPALLILVGLSLLLNATLPG